MSDVLTSAAPETVTLAAPCWVPSRLLRVFTPMSLRHLQARRCNFETCSFYERIWWEWKHVVRICRWSCWWCFPFCLEPNPRISPEKLKYCLKIRRQNDFIIFYLCLQTERSRYNKLETKNIWLSKCWKNWEGCQGWSVWSASLNHYTRLKSALTFVLLPTGSRSARWVCSSTLQE